MNTLKNRKLYEMASSYIKDGKLIKFRWYNDDIYHIDNFLHHKARQQREVVEGNIEYLKERGNLVIENDGEVELFNFDEHLLKLINE